MNRKYTYILLVLLVTTGLYFAEKYVDGSPSSEPETAKQSNTSTTEFGKEYLPSSTTGAIVHHSHYSLSYSEKHEQAEWVAYEVAKSHLSDNDFDRPYFIEDKKVRSGSADWRNYKRSGYDRGHLCPAGARRFSYDAYKETFLTSNISPQNHEFNSGIWNRLEQKVRRWANEHDGVYVITGGILKDGLKTIGSEKVSIPNEFYKIIIDNSGSKPKAIAFLIPNRDSSQSYFEYVTTIDILESKTGIDFLEGLPDATESTLESSLEIEHWQ
ncbi:DNA/RNA non-specific endonuclease [Aureisphaera galaxeae]|uniref:DNA/RNA non-specific endonuclease n=1 Tax=Aureisphaera galaxeae TaxID=1538023 RepID=UPI002350E79D|nr:DNA/RNA non-specific endonuclease [Aureisphaera galaxeae]MDC8003040.1 DNA/RNA non-specific endonuclease [Aureisphaera galaxeae]